MKTIYIVMGQTGEYSDRSQWPVRAFGDEAAAEAFAQKCTDAYIQQLAGRDIMAMRYEKWTHPLDPGFRVDYTGTDYFLYEVDYEEGS